MKKLIILELYVTGYERLALSDSKEFTITPDNIHLILGTNGCGKSSLMELLTPLAPSSKDFSDDGIARLTFMYGEDRFIRLSTNGKHTLQKNNDTILDSVGIQMMNEYIYEYFGITLNTQKFMLGRVNLCNMPLQTRKEFITNISGIDFDYVNKVYNSLKKQLRDNTGVVKYINNNILSMKEYILSDVEVEKLVADKNEIKRLLVKLYENKRPDKSIINIDKPDMVKILRRTESVFESMKEYDSNIDDLKSRFTLHNSKLIETTRRINEVSNTLTKMGDISSSDVLTRIKDITDEISTIRKNITIPTEYLSSVIERLKYNTDNVNIIDTIVELSLSLSGETKDSISDNIKDIDSKLLELSRRQKELVTDIDNTSMQITTYKTAMNGLSCPSCGFHFKEDSVSDIISKLEHHIEDIHSPKNDVEKEIEEYTSMLVDLNSKLKNKERLERLLGYIQASDAMCFSYEFDNVFSSYTNLYSFALSLSPNIKEYKKLMELEAEYVSLVSKDVSSTEKEVVSLTEEYDRLNDVISKLSTDTSSMKKLIDNHTQMNTDLLIVNKYISDVSKNRRHKIYSYMNKASNDIIFELNSKLSKIETVLDKYNYMSKSTNENLLELEKVNKDMELLELIIKELSPSTGLIAESIKSFLLGYINDVNSVIANVWSYDMEVLPYDVKELEKGISYRFPVKVNGQKPVADINDTSESMREIINLAFRIVSLKYMGLLGHPLMIDEFGRCMDDVHLIKSYDLLENLCTENNIQMFIIAHIKSAYTRFKQFGMSIVSDLNLEDME